MHGRDATVAEANLNQILPDSKGNQNVASLKNLFAAKGLYTQELVVLSGAHSIGHSRDADPGVCVCNCALYRISLYPQSDSSTTSSQCFGIRLLALVCRQRCVIEEFKALFHASRHKGHPSQFWLLSS